MSKKEPLEVIEQIELTKLYPFPDHPFGVRDDDSMQQTVESIREYGVLVPAIARPREDGGYELIAGHRRKHACELAGLKTMPVIVRDIDRNVASIPVRLFRMQPQYAHKFDCEDWSRRRSNHP